MKKEIINLKESTELYRGLKEKREEKNVVILISKVKEI